MNYLELSEEALKIISTITIAIVWIDIIYSWSGGLMKRDSIRKINIGLVLKHLVVVGYLVQGRLIFAVLWLGIIMLAMYTKKLARKSKALDEELEIMKVKMNKQVIDSISKRFGLDAKDFEIKQKDDLSAEVWYKDKIFDSSEHTPKED